MRVMAEADVVLALGSRLGPFGTLPQYGMDYWPKDAKIIQVDSDYRVLGLTKKIGIGICADAKSTASALLDELKTIEPARGRRDDAYAAVAAANHTWDEELKAMSSRSGKPISPRHGLQLVADALPHDCIVTTDIGNISSVANSYLRFRNPRRFLAAMSFGNCGYSYPTALGAKVGRPDLPVVAYIGDGAWGMSLAEVMTAVRENIPVVAIVWNNSQWGAEKRNQVDYYNNRFVGSNLENPDFAAVARDMGANGYRVEVSGRYPRHGAHGARFGAPVGRQYDRRLCGARRSVPPRCAQAARALPRALPAPASAELTCRRPAVFEALLKPRELPPSVARSSVPRQLV